jgi:ATP-dependent Lon protease
MNQAIAALVEKGLAVDKGKARIGDLARVPRHISEYLLTKLNGDTLRASEIIRRLCPPQSESNIVLHRIMEEAPLGSESAVILLDEVYVTPVPKIGVYQVRLSNLDLRAEIYTLSKIIRDNLSLLRYGCWGTVGLQYDFEEVLVGRKCIVMVDFKPVTAADVGLEDLAEVRRGLALDEWIELLINTCGLNPNAYSWRQRLLYLCRLLPLIEENVYLIELGPRATGKTYIYRNMTRYARIFSGGGISPAVLFYNAMTRELGELAVRDCVVFDEVSRIEFSDPYEMVGKLKDYMESGMYERGAMRQVRSGCSIVMQGNIDADHGSWEEALPQSMREPALIDRIQGLIPGWEMPKIMSADLHLSSGIGIAADAFSEIMHQMRSVSASSIIRDNVEITGQPSIRDERAITKIASALYKLLRPDLLGPGSALDREALEISMDLAVELRNRVREKLHEMIPSEFPGRPLEWRVRG